MGGFCARATSSVIDGVGPFKDLGIYWLPSSLGKKLSKIPEVNNHLLIGILNILLGHTSLSCDSLIQIDLPCGVTMLLTKKAMD